MTQKLPTVVLVGRPNVGKSTLFNRMTGSRRAIVAPIAGTTRDALARPVEWQTSIFQLFDEIGRRLGTAGNRDLGKGDRDLGLVNSGLDEPTLIPNPESLIPSQVGVAIVGRPNVGKSSLLNRLLKEERVLVSDMPGTTRDAIDAVLTWHRRRFRIVDTAGMRRAGRVRSGGAVELVSVAGAKKAIFDADVVALLIDSKEGATDQDAAIGGEAD